MTRFVALVGLPGSGKGEMARIASGLGIPVHAMGDIVREALVERGLAETPENVGATALAIRAEHGEDIVSHRILPRLRTSAADADLVLIDGVRQAIEMAVFRAAFGTALTVLAILAPDGDRAERIGARGRGEDGDGSAFTARDARERAWGLADLIDAADDHIDNSGDLAAFRSACDAWLGVHLGKG